MGFDTIEINLVLSNNTQVLRGCHGGQQQHIASTGESEHVACMM